MRVFLGCEASGTVRREFAALGHTVVSCDLRPAQDHAPAWNYRERLPGSSIGYHHEGDIFAFLGQFADGYFDLAICHPPCTDILLTGVRWTYKDGRRWRKDLKGRIVGENCRDPVKYPRLIEGAHFFKRLHEHHAFKKCVSENPAMAEVAQEIIGHPWTQHFGPEHFGHRERKSIYLWCTNKDDPNRNVPPLKLLPELYVGPLPREGEPGYKEVARVHHMGPNVPDRGNERSAFFPGVAKQMALQWGNIT